MGEGKIDYVPKSSKFIVAEIVLFVLLFALTPFQIHVRIEGNEIWAPFYSIIYTYSGMTIEAPFPRAMNLLPNPFLWINWLMVIFLFVLVAHHAGKTSAKNAKIVGWLSLGPGIVTFLVNLQGLLMGSLILTIPFPIPALIGLYVLYTTPMEYVSIWPESEANSE